MTFSLLSRLVGFATVAVALTAGIDYWSALHALQLQRLQQASRLFQRFARASPTDGSLLTGEVEVVAPGSMVRFLNVAAHSALPGVNDSSLAQIPPSLLSCLATEGRACVRGNVVAIKFPRSGPAGEVAIASLADPPWTELAFPIWGTALAICLLIWLALRKTIAACLTTPLRSIEQATDNFVSNGLQSFALPPSYLEPSKLPFPFDRLFSVGLEVRKLGTSVERMATALREWRQRISDEERQHLYWLSYLSHDLAAPLGRVLARLEALEYDADLSNQHRVRLLDSAHKEVTQLAEVVASISELPMQESDIESHFVQSPLNTLLEHAVDVFEFEACRKGVELDLRIGPDIGQARIERSLLRRAIENLISNALRFTVEGGLVSVRADRSDGVIRISVSDSGLGISSQDLPHIFEFALRGEQPTHPASFGSRGLELALVKRVAELHHGQVIARNLEPRGAEFVLSLPVIQ